MTESLVIYRKFRNFDNPIFLKGVSIVKMSIYFSDFSELEVILKELLRKIERLYDTNSWFLNMEFV